MGNRSVLLEWEASSNRELWIAFSSGERNALSQLFLNCYEQLFRYGMHFSKREETVKDGIQKLFLRLWRDKERLSCPESVDSYLYVSLRRVLLRRKERETARKERNADFLEDGLAYVFSIEELTIINEERNKRKHLFRKALQKLTPRQKEALLLRVDNGMSNAEISGIMQVSDKRVRNLIYEATRRLKEEIRPLAGTLEKH